MQYMHQPALYASVGRELTHYVVDVASAELRRRASVALPARVQYAWPHPGKPFLYVACSNGGPAAQGDSHCMVALAIDPATGTLIGHGAPVPLPARPIHATVDCEGAHVLTAYNAPSSLTVHRIEADGRIGSEVVQHVTPETGIYAHQVKVAPSGDMVIVVARGNDAEGPKREDPGSLEVFAYRAGQLSKSVRVAPNGGYGFGPRHIDFHPSEPWVYASLERQNTLHFYRRRGSTVETAPAAVVSTLQDTAALRRRQRPGTLHLHPNGRFVYVANRASGTETVDGKAVYIGGENNIAVFAIDPRSGEPHAIQHEDTRGIVPRTFALDSSGRLLVAANSVPLLAREQGGLRTILPGLSIFRVGDDGKLSYVRKHDIDTGAETMFWMGIVG